MTPMRHPEEFSFCFFLWPRPPLIYLYPAKVLENKKSKESTRHRLGNDLNGGSGNGGNLLAGLRDGGEDGDLLLGLHDGDHIGKGVLGAHLSSGVPGQHDLDLDTQDSLTEENVTDGSVNKVLGGLTRVDHESINELHGLGTGTAQLSGDNNLATLSTGLHDVTDNTVASTTDSDSVKELVLQGLALSNGRETTEVDLLGVELDSVLGELETLLDQRGQLADATTLDTKNLLGLGGTDDDLGTGRGDTDLDTRVTLSSELALEELVQLGVENTIGDELDTIDLVVGKRRGG